VSLRETLLRNTLWYGLVTAAGLVAGLGMSVVLARGLGPALMGEYSYVVWAARTLDAIASLGFTMAIVRYTAAALAKDDRALARGFVEHLTRRQLVTTAIVTAVTVPVALVLAPAKLRWPLVAVAVALFPLTLEGVYQYALYGAQRYDITARVSTVKMLLQLAAAVVVLGLGFDVLGLVVGTTLGSVVAAWLGWRRARGIYVDPPARIPEPMRQEMNAYLVPLSVVVVLDALVWDRSEVFFMRLGSTPHDIAFYSLAFGLATKAMIVPEIAVGALLPAFAALHGQGAPEEFQRVYRTAMRYVTLAGVPIVAVSVGVAPSLVALLYGADYLPVAALFSALAGIALFSALRRVAWAALRGIGDRRCAVNATAVAAVINVGAAAMLVGPWGSWGAVAANSAAQVIATVWALTVMTRAYGCGMPWIDLMKAGVAGALALGVTTAVGADAGVARLALAVALGFSTFAVAGLAMRIVGPREWALLVDSTRRLVARPA
jgi:O-antigen/teichoic acid export membrane protein